MHKKSSLPLMKRSLNFANADILKSTFKRIPPSCPNLTLLDIHCGNQTDYYDIICSGKQVKEMKALEINSRRHCTEISATKPETRSAFATVENLMTFFLILRTKLNSLNLKKKLTRERLLLKIFLLA